LATIWPTVDLMDDDQCGAIGGMLARETDLLGEGLFTTNPTLSDLVSNPSCHIGKPRG
jgi:hypothetical protein